MEASKSAKLYQHKTEGVQKKYGIQLLEYLPVKQGDIIGEIGCGSGNLASILARLVSCYKFIFSIKALDKKWPVELNLNHKGLKLWGAQRFIMGPPPESPHRLQKFGLIFFGATPETLGKERKPLISHQSRAARMVFTQVPDWKYKIYRQISKNAPLENKEIARFNLSSKMRGTFY